MTCICAYKVEDKVYLAGDRIATNLYSASSITQPKVFPKGQFFVGYTSSFRMGNLLQFSWIPPHKIIEDARSDYEFMCTDVVTSLRDCFKENGFGNKDGIEESAGVFLLVFNNNIYLVQGNYSVMQYEDDIVSVGSGEAVMYGAMKALSMASDEPLLVLQTAMQITGTALPTVTTTCDILECFDTEEGE